MKTLKWLVSFVSTGIPLILLNLDFESFATVRENSSFDFGVNDDTVKEADGSSSSSGVGSTTRTNDTELTDLEKDETKKSSNFDDDSLNASIDDADALFGECKSKFS